MKKGILLGALGIAAVATVAASGSSKKEESPKSFGETWKYVLAVHPDIPSVAEFQSLSDTFKYYLVPAGGEVLDVETPAPNTLEVTVKFPMAGMGNKIELGKEHTIGTYTVIPTTKYKVES